jgi:hypothetical protein
VTEKHAEINLAPQYLMRLAEAKPRKTEQPQLPGYYLNRLPFGGVLP